jgi:hypothetical protein
VLHFIAMRNLTLCSILLLFLSGCIKVEEVDPCEGSAELPVLNATGYNKNLGDTLVITVTNFHNGSRYTWQSPNGDLDSTYGATYRKFLPSEGYEGNWRVKAYSNDGLCVTPAITFSVGINTPFLTCVTGNNAIKIGSLSNFSMGGRTITSSGGLNFYSWTNPSVSFKMAKKGSAFYFDPRVFIVVDSPVSSLTSDVCVLEMTYNGTVYTGQSGKFYTKTQSGFSYMDFCDVSFKSNSGSTLNVSGRFAW